MAKELINGHIKVVFSKEEKERIVKWFVDDGYSMRQICKFFNIARSKPIAKILDEYGIDHSRGNISSYKYNYPNGIYNEDYEKEIKDKISKIPFSNNKYNINQYYFDDLRNPEAIYIIGFLYADGCNHDNKTISMCLEECDGYILELINQKLNNEKSIRFIDYSNKHDFGYNYENQY